MPEKIPKQWPFVKRGRFCNIDHCPVFHLTEADVKFLDEASKKMRLEKKTAEEVSRELGIPVGTCLVSGQDRVVNSECNVEDQAFYDYYSKL